MWVKSPPAVITKTLKGHLIFGIIISDLTSTIRRNEMTSSNTLLKKIIGVKDVVVTDAEIYSDHDGVTHLTIDARPNSWNRNKCPFC